MKKQHFELKGPERSQALHVARGDDAADLLLKNARVLDLVSGSLELTNVAISGRFIAGVDQSYTEGHRIIDLDGKFITPGFIDAHVHLESSLMHPFEFEARTLKHGTTTAIADPHEITNVLGVEGIAWILRCADAMHQNLLVQVPSCVPAINGMETNGGTFTLEQMLTFKDHPNVLGLAEMMNVPGVIFANPEVLEKIDAFSDTPLDGHAPMLRGKELNAYCLCGIKSCHESVDPNEAREKLRHGISVMLREGSAAKNLDHLAEIVTPFNCIQCLLCTDDRNPLDIDEEGHIDSMVRRLIQKHHIPPHIAYRMSSFSTAKHYGLNRLGLVAPGYLADLIILDNLEEVAIHDVIKSGKLLSETKLDPKEKLISSQPPLFNSVNRNPVNFSDVDVSLDEGVYRVIEVIPHEIITKEKHIYFDGSSFEEEGVLPINVCERYGQNLPIAKGLVTGFGSIQGAIATSIAHDSHNLICIGKAAEDRAFAINSLIDSGGGIVIVANGKVLAKIDLPLAGLISLETGDMIAEKLRGLRQAAEQIGCLLHEPFLHMSFLALPVIPELKITDKGLVKAKTMSFAHLRVI